MTKTVEKIKINPQDKMNGSWVQTERDGHKLWIKLTMDNQTASALLHCLVSLIGDKNAVVISQASLSKMLNRSVDTISRAIKYLEARNWIQVLKLGKGKECAYVVNSRVAWCQTRDKLIYALFSANVVVDSEDQEEVFEQELKQIPPIIFAPFFEGRE